MKKVNKAKIISLIAIILAIFCMIIGLIFGITKKEQVGELEGAKAKYYILEQNYQYGIIDLDGKIIIEPQYDDIDIPNPSKDVFFCTSINETEIEEIKILDEKNQEILREYENVLQIELQNDSNELQYEKQVLKYEVDGKYGLISYEGKKITDPIYEKIESVKYRPGELLVKKDNKYGVINSNGKILIKIKYDNIEGDGYYHQETEYSQTGYITCLRQDDGYKYGYINNTGRQILKNEYSEIYRILDVKDKENTYLVARKEGKVGFIKNDKKVLDFEYQSVEYDSYNEVIKVQKNVEFGVYNINGEEILPMKYTEISFRGKYIYAEKEEKIEYYTLNGQLVKDLTYLSVNPTDNEEYYTCINADGLYGILDKNENVLVENEYQYLEYLYGEYFIAIEEEKLGIIKSNNDIMLPFEYDTINKVENSEVIVATKNEGKSYILRKDFKVEEELENPIIEKREDKIAIYSKDKNLYLDQKGNEINSKDVFKENMLYARKENGKWGFEDKDGKAVVNCDYEYVTEFNSYGFAGIKLNGKWGAIDKEGKVIVEPKYQIEEGILPSFIGEYYTLEQGNQAIYISE